MGGEAREADGAEGLITATAIHTGREVGGAIGWGWAIEVKGTRGGEGGKKRLIEEPGGSGHR